VSDCTLYLVFKIVSAVPKYHFKYRQNVSFYRPCFQKHRDCGACSLPHATLTLNPRPAPAMCDEIIII